jgi:hypothetical protein
MPTDQARNRLFASVRTFALTTPPWGEALRYFTKPDERHDMTAISQRVYGRRGEPLVVQAAAGLDSPELELTERLLVLPTDAQLRAMKLDAGFTASELY